RDFPALFEHFAAERPLTAVLWLLDDHTADPPAGFLAGWLHESAPADPALGRLHRDLSGLLGDKRFRANEAGAFADQFAEAPPEELAAAADLAHMGVLARDLPRGALAWEPDDILEAA
ncbi:MAG: hypothetical protein H7841_16250, partial [Magnetospirillum sp. WYHS-4]